MARPRPRHRRWRPLLAAWACSASVIGDLVDDNTNNQVKEFVALQQTKADQAFEELYGDGLGLDGEEPPLRESFIETYVVEALNRETKRILAEKGYPAEPKTSSASRSLLDVEKKDSPTTLEGEVERLVVQKRQKRAVRERVRDGKPLEVIEPGPGTEELESSRFWEVDCGESLYRDHVYDSISGCSPGPPAGLPCGRLLADGFLRPGEEEQMVAMMDRSFQGLFHQGEETLLVPEAESHGRMGAEGFKLTVELLERARTAVAQRLNISKLYYSGSLLKRMDYPPLADEMQLEPDHDSSNPHVDKANIASYDWSCLLYLSSVGRDFGGGELVFNDAAADRLVEPRAGRLLAFSSGLENLHRVLPMQWGRRYVLSMWFTCSERHAHPALVSSVRTGTGARRRRRGEL